ncbi:MAG: signal recognition particle-docking protein FtsY [Armatimonadetes bacterium]|nr:signal recognition particle-docking protein FtsY [Armatimonadota bacterium]
MAMFRRLMERVDRIFGRGVIDEDLYEELEEALLQSDTHILTATEIIEDLRKAIRSEKVTSPEGIKERLQEEIRRRFDQGGNPRLAVSSDPPTVYLFVGVNGVGKTTTIGKLAKRLTQQGKRVLLAAGDTFRAAAIEQLQMWAERSGADFVGALPNSDPASVLFDAVTAAKARGCDYVLADTAGRQHTKGNLMKELEKVSKVTEKALGRSPDEVLLVLDANTGQNAIRQAEEFTQASGVTGLVLTKLDGTARGGALIGVWERFHIPVKLIGVGEWPEDLRDFDAGEFARQLFDSPTGS